eukprot:8566049-Karenia_brevis.AAC.1
MHHSAGYHYQTGGRQLATAGYSKGSTIAMGSGCDQRNTAPTKEMSHQVCRQDLNHQGQQQRAP